MNLAELQSLLRYATEDEHIEFKEAKTDYSVLGSSDQRKSVYGYAVAMGNEHGGKLILGIDNKKNVVGTHAFPNLETVKSKLFEKLKKTHSDR
jgi:ATP-dependent DNA helicase RecG